MNTMTLTFLFHDQVWPTTAAIGVLYVLLDVCGPECILPIVRGVCHHEVLYRNGTLRNEHNLHCSK